MKYMVKVYDAVRGSAFSIEVEAVNFTYAQIVAERQIIPGIQEVVSITIKVNKPSNN